MNQFYFDNFFCFGKYEINHYKKNNININNYKIIGSLQLSNYLNYLKIKKKTFPKTKFDISVISEGSTNLDQEYGVNNLAFNWTKIITYSIKFAKENGLRFNFIFKRQKKRGKGFYESEIKYLRKYLNQKNINYLLKNCNYKDSNNLSPLFHCFFAVPPRLKCKLIRFSKRILSSSRTCELTLNICL